MKIPTKLLDGTNLSLNFDESMTFLEFREKAFETVRSILPKTSSLYPATLENLKITCTSGLLTPESFNFKKQEIIGDTNIRVLVTKNFKAGNSILNQNNANHFEKPSDQAPKTVDGASHTEKLGGAPKGP